MSTGLAGPQGWGRPLPVPGRSPLPTPHVPQGASRVINPQSSPQCYPLGREREATLTTQAWNRNTGSLGLGRRKPVAYVEGKGKKKKASVPLHRSLNSFTKPPWGRGGGERPEISAPPSTACALGGRHRVRGQGLPSNCGALARDTAGV